MTTLSALAAQLREEGTPLSPHVIEPGGADPASGEYALLFESIREGYLLHYGESRLLDAPDADLALLAGDYLYALGLARLADIGDDRAVVVLADLIARCAQLHAEGQGEDALRLWSEAAGALGLS